MDTHARARICHPGDKAGQHVDCVGASSGRDEVRSRPDFPYSGANEINFRAGGYDVNVKRSYAGAAVWSVLKLPPANFERDVLSQIGPKT